MNAPLDEPAAPDDVDPERHRSADAPALVGVDVRPGDRAPGGRRRVPQARPAPDGPQPGDVRRRDRQRRHHAPVHPRRGTARPRPTTSSPGWSRRGCGSPCCSPTSPRRWPRAAARRRPTRCARRASETVARVRQADGTIERGAVDASSQVGDRVRRRRRRDHPRRRRRRRGHRDGRRVGHHRRVGAGHPRVGRRPLRRSPAARGCSPTRSSCSITSEAGRDLPRPDDRARRGREPAEDAERDRPQHPARRAHDHLPARGRDAAAVRRSTRAPQQSIIVLVALLVCLIPTTIGALLSAIGIAGMDRLVQRNVLAMSGRAVEAAGDCSTLLLDKTGTITLGNRQAAEFLPVPGRRPSSELAEAAQLSSLADETPEGRSIVVLAKERYGLREPRAARAPTLVPFTAQTRMSGRRHRGPVDPQGRGRLGAALGRRSRAARVPHELDPIVDGIAKQRRHAARRRRRRPRPRRHPPQGHREGGHRRALRRAAAHGHPHGDDHRRQPAHRGGDRRGGRRRRLPRRGDARGQDGADQARAGRAARSSR